MDAASRASLEPGTPVGHDHGAGPSALPADWTARPRSGVANPVRRQTWPWNGCGTSLAAGRTLLSLLPLLRRFCRPVFFLEITGRRLALLASDARYRSPFGVHRTEELAREMPQVSGNLYLSRPAKPSTPLSATLAPKPFPPPASARYFRSLRLSSFLLCLSLDPVIRADSTHTPDGYLRVYAPSAPLARHNLIARLAF